MKVQSANLTTGSIQTVSEVIMFYANFITTHCYSHRLTEPQRLELLLPFDR